MGLKHTQFPGLACFHVLGPNPHFTCWPKQKLRVKRLPARLIVEAVTGVTSLLCISLLFALLLTCRMGPRHGCSAALLSIQCPIITCMAHAPRAGLPQTEFSHTFVAILQPSEIRWSSFHPQTPILHRSVGASYPGGKPLSRR